MDAIALLIADHNRVRGLFARFETAKEAEDAATMSTLGDEIFTELTVHTTIEEEIFYPWIRGLADEVSELVDEGVQEHHVVKVLMEELGGLSAEQDEWVAKMAVLIENVEHHADEEETEMFPKVTSNSSAEQREELAQQLEARKAELGAPTLADKIDLTLEELKSLATEQEIPGRSTMSQEELAATVAPK